MAEGTFSCTRSGCPLQCEDHLGPSMLLYPGRKSALPPLKELAPTGSWIDSYYSHTSSVIRHALCPLRSELVPSSRSFNRSSIAARRPKVAIFDILANIPVDIDQRLGQQRREVFWNEVNVPIPEYDDLEIIEVTGVQPDVLQQQKLRAATVTPPIPDIVVLDCFANVESPEVTDSGVGGSNPDLSQPRTITKVAAPTGNRGEVQVSPSEQMVEVEQEEKAPKTNATPLPPAVDAIRTKGKPPGSDWKRMPNLAGDLETDSGMFSQPTSDQAESLVN